MKISQRITLFSTLMLFLLLLIVNSSVYFLFSHYTMTAEMNQTQAQGRTIAEALNPDSIEWVPSDYLSAYVPGEGMVRVVRANGDAVISITKNPQMTQLSPQFSTEESVTTVSFGGEQRMAAARTPVIWENGEVVTLEVYEPMTMYEETTSLLLIILTAASLMILVPSFFAGRSLSRFILRPVKALVKTMNDIREEGAFKKIEVEGKSKDELTEMGRTFNHMIDLLEENYEKQQQFVSDASHELKTPLTVIDSYARLLKRWGKEKREVLEEAVNAVSSEAQRMKEMTNQMLALATGEKTITTELEKINLGHIMYETARQLKTAYNRDIRVANQGDQPPLILGNAMQLKQLAYILIENGLKYSDDRLEIEVESTGPIVKVSVTDYGIGISEEDLPHVFNRFYRVDKARSRKTGGSGLGLSIAKKIADLHQGKIEVRSKLHEGTTFTVTFPALTEEVRSNE